ncbi:MAG: hypothetical protein ACOC4G_06800, partial [Bacillota bacterium]
PKTKDPKNNDSKKTLNSYIKYKISKEKQVKILISRLNKLSGVDKPRFLNLPEINSINLFFKQIIKIHY